MNKNSLFKRVISSILALVMILGAFTALDGVFSGVKAETVNPDGSITYGASDSAIVMNKDAWLEPDGTYAIDLTAYTTGQKTIEAIEFDAPTDFIIVVEQNCLMVDYYCYSDCYNYMSMATYKLAAAKSIARALVDELHGDSDGGVDHRVGIIGYGGYSCYNNDSNTGLFDNTGRWYNYRFSFGSQFPVPAQSKYDSALVHVNTAEGYNILKNDIKKFNTMTASMGGYTDAGLEMAKGVINATKNDTYQAVDANGTVTNVPRKKVVVLISDGTPGYEGFDMQIAADAVTVATDIKKNFDAKIFSVTLSTELEEQITAYDWRGTMFSYQPDSFHINALPINKRAYNPQYGKGAWNQYNSTIYSTLKFNYEEFFTRDFTTILSSAYPCTESYGPNGPITGKYMTNLDAYSYVGQGNSGVYTTNGFPMYYRSGSYASYVQRNKSIAYFFKDAGGRNKLITGLYDNNVRSYNNRIAYNNHPIDKVADPAYGKYYIKVNEPKNLVNGSYSNPNYDVPTASLKAMISKIVSEIPEGTSYSGSSDMNTIGEAYIKDIISDYFFYHSSFDPAVNVKTFTQDVIGYQNGEYVFAKNLVPYNNAIVKHYDDVVTVAGFDYDANTCYRDNNGIHGKKFIVQIRGLRAKSTTVGDHLRIANTPGNISGLYAVSDTNDNGGNSGNSGAGVPVTSVSLTGLTVFRNSKKIPVLNIQPDNANVTVAWTSSNPNVATVDATTGLVTGRTSGTATLTAKVTDNVSGQVITKTATITVPSGGRVYDVNFVIPGAMNVAQGSSKPAFLYVMPDSSNYSMNWSVDNPAIATVDAASGLVTGVRSGSTTLRVTVTDLNNGLTYDKSALLNVFGGSSNPNPDPKPNNDKLIVVDGDEAIFPIPYVNIRDKSIVYDFSLKIQDDNAITFFEKDASSHDVRHVLTVDDAYAKQEKIGNSYKYHETYPYAENANFDSYKNHFEVGIVGTDEHGDHAHTDKNCHAYVDIKSINGNRYDVATLLELTSTRRDIITGEMKTVYEWCRVYFLPATNVHYEESLLSFTDAVGSANGIGNWVVNGQANGSTYDVATGKMLEGTKYSNAFQSTANKNYGHDAEYHNFFESDKERDTHGDSNGRAMSVKVDNELRKLVDSNKAEWPKVEFTFRGNELDIMSRIGHDTGVLAVDIVPIDKEYSYIGATDSAHIIVDTYYSEGLFYQIPVLHYDRLDWGDYKVKIRAMYSRAFDHQTKGYVPTKGEEDFPGLEEGVEYQIISACTYGEGTPTRTYGTFNVYLDGIRVYNPHVEQLKANELEGHEYYKADEHNPDFSQVRARLIDAGSFGGAADRVTGIVYIDGSNGNPVTIEDYERFGPNNEAYLTPGNGFAFTVKEFKKQTDRLHISAKSPNAKDVIMSVNGVKYTIDSATELFFDVTDAVKADGRVVITCSDKGNTPDAVLSVCHLKLVSNTKTRGGDRFYVDSATIDNAIEVSGIEYVALPIITNFKVAIASRMPSITWNAVAGATYYQVWRMPVGGTFEQIATVTEPAFVDESDLTVGTKYYYKVRAVDQYNHHHNFTGAVSTTIPNLAAPKSFKATVSARKPVLSWKAASYAAGYEVWRMADGDSDYELVATVNTVKFTEPEVLTGGQKYFYKIRTVDARGYVSDFTGAAAATIPALGTPTSFKAKITSRQPVVSWKKVSYAVGYQVWRMLEGAEDYELIATVTGVSYTDTTAFAGGQKCYYKVRAVDAEGVEGSFTAAAAATVPVLAAAKSFTVKLTSRKPVLSWKKVSYAVAYEVWRMEDGGNFELIDTVTGVKYTDTGALCGGQKYTYKVRAIDKNDLPGNFTAEKTITFPNLGTPTKVKAVISEGAPQITWTAVSYATGYAVYRSTSATEGFELAGAVNVNSFIDEAELTPGVRYYYKVVALDDFGNVSALSAAASAVIPQ